MSVVVRTRFHEELAALEATALGAMDLVVEQLDRVLLALREGDTALAELVVMEDDRIDGRYLEVHQGVLSLLALQAPVAGDLRLIAALLHVIRHIERMGDHCVNVAKLVPLSAGEPPEGGALVAMIERMGAAARAEVLQAQAAFEARSMELAADLARQDREINALNRDVFREAVAIGGEAEVREWATAMTIVARMLERIGDHAVDVGEQVAFVIGAHPPRHAIQPSP
ncbi:MAG TPA: phosphate signaling complex protein PhoU [Solirubrobacteraceae bacterium]|nr:phosphate signaling complex protein PhoU [Solirubrobacteraceae bacterium]